MLAYMSSDANGPQRFTNVQFRAVRSILTIPFSIYVPLHTQWRVLIAKLVSKKSIQWSLLTKVG